MYLITFKETSQYNFNKWYSIIINIKVVKALTAGFSQYFIYKETVDLIAIFNTFNTGAIKVKFRIGLILSVNSLKVQLLVRETVFYIIYTNTLFLISLQDLDFLDYYYNNLTNEVVTPISTVPVV
jgi:hypothetical protein